jgi:hypothetical protein
MVIFPCVTPTGPPSAVLETATPLFIAKTGWLSGMPNISKYIQIQCTLYVLLFILPGLMECLLTNMFKDVLGWVENNQAVQE